ncbi:MAG: hypothetical protein HZB38_04825, partial [Planctomycetes bacterium]|nr:hypothetical protein [Planctomycetota bacterium]
MNKAFAIFVALIVAALAAVYLRGGISTWDPEKKGAEVKAAIAPGMSWSQVLDLDEPGKLQTTYKTKKKIAGEEIEVVEFGAVQNFDRAMFEREWKGKSFADGFAF